MISCALAGKGGTFKTKSHILSQHIFVKAPEKKVDKTKEGRFHTSPRVRKKKNRKAV